jgi:zinc protease
MLRKIETAYGGLPTHPVPEETISREPALSSERRVEVTGPDSTVYLGISYRAPAANDEDFSALAVLDSLLCGPTSLNTFGGGGTTNKTSRIYKALVEKDLAVSAHGGFSATIDPYLYEIDLTLRPERSVNEVLRAVDDLISQMQEELVKPEEVARAVKQARALFAYGSENITNQAFWLGYALIFASYPWFTGYVDRLAQVTPEDIRRIAQKYLIPAHRVVGSYLPDGAAGGVK